MRLCPACEKWALDFDEYFSRFRCFNPECGWMPASSVEREIQLIRTHRQPKELSSQHIEELGITLRASYDPVNDALLFDFGLGEPTFEMPEGDGIMVWKIGRLSGSVAGFTILGAVKFRVARVNVDLDARKESIERGIRNFPKPLASGSATRVLIKSAEVTAHTTERPAIPPRISNAAQEAMRQFREQYLESGAMTP
jgi:hypothetical protein